MKKDVLIKITGVQIVDGEVDSVELFTTGSYCRRNGHYHISYTESETTGYEGSKTTLTVEDQSKVTLLRSSPNRSQLIIEKGKRHQCNYDTGYGNMTIGVSGDQIVSSLGDDGGEVFFKYSLDINSSLASENEVRINVRESTPN